MWAGQSFGLLESDGWRQHLKKYFAEAEADSLLSPPSHSLSLSLPSLSPFFLMAGEIVSASPATLCMGIQDGIMGKDVSLKPEDRLSSPDSALGCSVTLGKSLYLSELLSSHL